LSLQIPQDLDVLRYLDKPKTRYQVAIHLGNHTVVASAYMNRLEKLGLVFVVETRPWHRGEVKKYLITAKGRAVLRGFMEAERRT